MSVDVKGDLPGFLREAWELTEHGAPAIVAAFRYMANGQELEVDAVSSKGPSDRWTPEKVAERIEAVITRDARGLPGVTQYQICVCYGTNPKPQKFLPLQRLGQTAYHHPGGGLATESATPTGVAQIGARWGELAIQQAGAKDQLITGLLGQLLDKLSVRLSESEKRSDERADALMQVLTLWQQQQVSTQVRALMLDGARRLLPLLPALAGATTGLAVPTDVAESSFFDAMVEAYPPEQLKAYVASLTPPANAVAADLLLKAQKRKQRRQADQQTRLSYDEASEDAAGQAWRALSGRTAPDLEPAARIVKALDQHDAQQKTNGQSNGHTTKVTDDGAALLDELIALLPDAHGALVGMIEGKDPALAARLQKRLDAHRKEG